MVELLMRCSARSRWCVDPLDLEVFLPGYSEESPVTAPEPFFLYVQSLALQSLAAETYSSQCSLSREVIVRPVPFVGNMISDFVLLYQSQSTIQALFEMLIITLVTINNDNDIDHIMALALQPCACLVLLASTFIYQPAHPSMLLSHQPIRPLYHHISTLSF